LFTKWYKINYIKKFLRKKIKSSKEETLLNIKITKTHVHIERIKQRLKTFKILSDKRSQGLFSNVNNYF